MLTYRAGYTSDWDPIGDLTLCANSNTESSVEKSTARCFIPPRLGPRLPCTRSFTVAKNQRNDRECQFAWYTFVTNRSSTYRPLKELLFTLFQLNSYVTKTVLTHELTGLTESMS